MSRYLIVRLLDTFFRRWWLFILPLLLLGGFGAASIATASSVYRSSGVMYVETSTLLSQLTQVRDAGFSWETPASLTSQQLNGLLQTDGFVRSVADQAGLSQSVERGTITLAKLRASVTSWSEAKNLVVVRASLDDPTTTFNLAKSTITAFSNWVIEANIAESTAAERFFGSQLDSYQKDLSAKQAALDAYVAQHPEVVDRTRPLAEQIEIDRLTADVSTANARYAETLGKNDSARLATEQTRSDVGQRLRLVDQPELPSAPDRSLKSSVLKLAVYLILGGILTAAAVVAAALTDRTIRDPSDVSERLGCTLLGILPEVNT